MKIAPIQSHYNHTNFMARVRVKGDLSHTNQEIIEYWKSIAEDIGNGSRKRKRHDFIDVILGEPYTGKPDTFSEQGHFYDVNPRKSRNIRVHGKIGNRWIRRNISYDTFEDSSHRDLTASSVSEYLRELDDEMFR